MSTSVMCYKESDIRGCLCSNFRQCSEHMLLEFRFFFPEFQISDNLTPANGSLCQELWVSLFIRWSAFHSDSSELLQQSNPFHTKDGKRLFGFTPLCSTHPKPSAHSSSPGFRSSVGIFKLWALYTYEDDSNDLTLASSGDGGLAEIMVTFDNGCIMYGFCSLKEPTSALPRYILINWVGEDVPDARKCACASHVATIAEFFQVGLAKGVDVIINASSMDDIDPSAIGQRLTNGTGPSASPVLGRLRMRDEENAEHVGTTYQKTNAEIEMKRINREEFWEQAKREEELRKEEERKKLAEERQRFEDERMELERKEQEEREKRYRERERQIEEHRQALWRTSPDISIRSFTEPSCDDLSQDKKESEVEEAAAIIAQRTSNPREFFKQREKAVASSLDTSPISSHRTGRLDSPFLKQQHSVCVSSTSSSRTPGPLDDSPEGVSTASPTPPIPKIAIQEDKDDNSEKEWAPESPERVPVQESEPVQTDVPQDHPTELKSTSAEDTLMDMWESSPAPTATPCQAPHIMDLMGDADSSPSLPQPLLSFDDVPDAQLCPSSEDAPSSLVDVAESHHMTLSYQQASDSQELDESQELLTNGDSLLKEGTQASEGYFSQSQEEDFAQSDECSAKVNPTPVFYNKPPEIDITCWDTDPVVDDDD
ncbi:drebrin isoform X5 [Ictalurus punctatus]|uniref:Drebrin n=1 Tax=Ictalurus punctatus TaxID=7998 RepID=A0A9F7RIY8_ICTPU|nr:drebrin isoform X5 [Ictalurus punctatus]